MDTTNTPKIFISYSWNPIINKKKVIALAERLTSDGGIHVVLDVWDLKEGNDKYAFMESMVNSDDIDKVLIICNKDYAEKSNSKVGGVGIESTIISSEVYNKVNQEKFIPIIFERDESGNEFVPTFIKSRIYIDLFHEESYEDNYETLLRAIYNKPLLARPVIGSMPSFLNIEEPKFLKTGNKVSAIKNSFLNEKKHTNILIKDYLDTIVEIYKQGEISSEEFENGLPIDDVVIKYFDHLMPLKEDFEAFMNVVLKYGYNLNYDLFKTFFSDLAKLKIALGTNYSHRHDHILLSLHELMLYFTAMMLKFEKFAELEEILTDAIIISKEFDTEIASFCIFYHYSQILDEFRKRRLNLNRVSVFYDQLVKRCNSSYISFVELQEADIMLHYLIMLNDDIANLVKLSRINNRWFPYTTLREIYGSLPIMSKAIKISFFDKVKILFRVENKSQLIEKSEAIQNKGNWVSDFHFRIPNFENGLNLKSIATIK